MGLFTLTKSPLPALLCAAFIQAGPLCLIRDGKPVSHYPGLAGAGQAYTVLAKIPEEAPKGGPYWPRAAGKRKVLALLVDFSDAPAVFSVAQADSFLNQKGYRGFGNKGSVRDYWHDVSGGALDLQFDVKGYYRAKRTVAQYDSTGEFDTVITEAINHYDSAVDFTQYGSAVDAEVNSIFIFLGGKDFFGAMWEIPGLRRDGRLLGRIAVTTMDLGLYDAPTLQVPCHEMGHMFFGWPDLYKVRDSTGLGPHCVMSSLEDDPSSPYPYDPAPPNEMLRADQGWLDVATLAPDAEGAFSLPGSRPGARGRAIRINNPANIDESFWLFNRRNEGRYSANGGTGMIIYHFDRAWDSSLEPQHASLTLVPPGGKMQTTPETPVYFHRGGIDVFEKKGQGQHNDWHDGKASGIRIHSIGVPADTMTFRMGGGTVGLRSSQARENPGPPILKLRVGGNGAVDARGRRVASTRERAHGTSDRNKPLGRE